MEYRALGASGLKISRLALGCGNFGGIGSAPEFFGMGENESDAAALLDRALESGITTLDTADAYGGGRSEQYIGRWLRGKGSRLRDHLVIGSKVFNTVGRGANERGLSRVHILRQIDASLRRLATDRLDMYLIHEPDPDTPIDETLRAMEDVVRSGRALYVGASNVTARQLARADAASAMRGHARFGWVQNSYSLLDRAAERELLPLCRAAGIGFMAFSPLAGGWLTGKYTRDTPYPEGSRMTLRPEPYRGFERDRVFDAIEMLRGMAAARGEGISAVALAWLLDQSAVDGVVIGPRRPAQLDAALGALEVRLSDAEREKLSAAFAFSG